jgi:PKD repeat protein
MRFGSILFLASFAAAGVYRDSNSVKWVRTEDTSGGPVDLSRVTSIEFHADVWNAGYTFRVDGLTLGGSEVTEDNASSWGVFDTWTATSGDSVSNDAGDVKVGNSSIKFTTDSGSDSGCFYPKSRNASWNLSSAPNLTCWMKFGGENPLQMNLPAIVLTTAAGGKVRIEPSANLISTAWTQVTIPLNYVTFAANPPIGMSPLDCTFSYSSWYPVNVAEFSVDVNGDGTADVQRNNAGNLTWTYSTPGTYMAALTLRDTGGAVYSATLPVQVQPSQKLVLNATPRDGLAPLVVTFAFDSTDGSITEFKLDADGNGTFDFVRSQGGKATWIFSQPGYYLAKLEGKNSSGTIWTKTISINVFAAGSRPEYTARPRVLMVNYNPYLEAFSKTLSEHMLWASTQTMIKTYRNHFLTASGGHVDYEIVDVIERDEWPIHLDGFRHSDQSWIDSWNSGKAGAHVVDGRVIDGDLYAILRDNRIVERIQAEEIDEVWLAGAPGFGHPESFMIGKGAFRINGPALTDVNCRATAFKVFN